MLTRSINEFFGSKFPSPLKILDRLSIFFGFDGFSSEYSLSPFFCKVKNTGLKYVFWLILRVGLYLFVAFVVLGIEPVRDVILFLSFGDLLFILILGLSGFFFTSSNFSSVGKSELVAKKCLSKGYLSSSSSASLIRKHVRLAGVRSSWPDIDP